MCWNPKAYYLWMWPYLEIKPPEARWEVWNKFSLITLRRNQPYQTHQFLILCYGITSKLIQVCKMVWQNIFKDGHQQFLLSPLVDATLSLTRWSLFTFVPGLVMWLALNNSRRWGETEVLPGPRLVCKRLDMFSLHSLGTQLPRFKLEADLDFQRQHGNMKYTWSIPSVANTNWQTVKMVFHILALSWPSIMQLQKQPEPKAHGTEEAHNRAAHNWASPNPQNQKWHINCCFSVSKF